MVAGYTGAVSRVIPWVNERQPPLVLFDGCNRDIPLLLNHLSRRSAEKINTAGRLMPSGGSRNSMFDELERVPRAYLHHSGMALNLGEVKPVRWWVQPAQRRITSYTEARAAKVNQAKTLPIGDVEHIPAEL